MCHHGYATKVAMKPEEPATTATAVTSTAFAVGRHRFDVQPLGEGRSRFVQSERLSGALVPLFRSMLTGPTPEAFAAMNDALAKRALDAL
jgi:hypothetical protein